MTTQLRRIVFDIDPETGEVEQYEYDIKKKPPPLHRGRIEKKEGDEEGEERLN